MRKLTFLSLVFFCFHNCFGESSPGLRGMHDLVKGREVNNGARPIYLVELTVGTLNSKSVVYERNTAVTLNENNEPNLVASRLYKRWDEQLKGYIYDVTNARKGFENPARALVPLSEVTPEWTGSPSGSIFVYLGAPKGEGQPSARVITDPNEPSKLWKAITPKEAQNKYMFWNRTDGVTIHFHTTEE